jgi:hypothetical protein
VKEVAEVLGINKATVKTRSVSAASNDQCEQFNDADSYDRASASLARFVFQL